MILIRINIDGSMNDVEMKNITLKNIEKKAISKGTTDLKKLYSWIYNNTQIHCYGWYDGEQGFENKHDLIPGGNSSFLCDEDSSEKLLFGDIFLACFDIKTKKFKDFSVSDYGIIYDHFFEGFYDCESEDEISESEEETNEDKNFINDCDDNDINTDFNYSTSESEELEEDFNDYTTSEDEENLELYDSD